MSILSVLHKQELIRQRNDLQLQMLQNSSRQRNMLANPFFMGNLEAANNYETSLELENISNSAILSSIDCELNALQGSKLNYLA